mgnify:CR=1 FL=1
MDDDKPLTLLDLFEANYTSNKLSKDQLLLLGTIMAECGYLEAIIQMLIWELSGLTSGAGASITAHMSMNDKLNALTSLSGHILEEHELNETIQDLCKQTRRDILPKRNDLAHIPWSPTEDGKGIEAQKIKARGKLQVDFKTFSNEELDNFRRPVTLIGQGFSEVSSQLEKYFQQAAP